MNTAATGSARTPGAAGVRRPGLAGFAALNAFAAWAGAVGLITGGTDFGDVIDAPTAERYGLFNKVVAPEKVMEEAMAWATRLANGPTFALGMTKELLNGELNMDLWNALENEARAQAVCMQTKDFRRAYEAFVAKQKPQFAGN